MTYQLKLPESWKIHKVLHATLLHPYKENEVYGENYPRPLPDIENGEEVYEVEQVLKHRRRGRGYEYLVKWAGYSAKIIQPALMSLMSLAVFELLWEHLAGCKNLKKC